MGGENSGLAGEALMAVARYRLGRILLWLLATPFLFVGSLGMYANRWGSNDARLAFGVFCIGGVIALFPMVGAWRAYRESRPSPIRWFLLRLAFAGLILGGAMLLTWLLRGRSKAALAPPPEPPGPEEVDRLCATEELAG